MTENATFTTPNGVTLRLPVMVLPGQYVLANNYAQFQPTAQANTSINPNFDGLGAIWDQYNGTTTGVTGLNGLPTNWASGRYLSSSRGETTGKFGTMGLSIGFGTEDTPNTNFAVAFEVIDTRAPELLSITNNASGPLTTSDTLLYTFTFSENVKNFVQGDVVISGASAVLGAWTVVSPSVYTLAVTPTGGGETLKVSVNDGSYMDYSGNVNNAGNPTHSQDVSGIDSPAGQAVIDLGSFGQLIKPVQVEGNWYYILDKNKSGTITTADAIAFNALESYLDVAATDATAANRLITINGVQLAIPTKGTTMTAGSGYPTPTAYSYPNGDDPTPYSNASLSDLAAIWDAFNGTVTTGYPVGAPADWGHGGNYASAGYWAANLNSTGVHEMLKASGFVSYAGDGFVGDANITPYAVLQVL